MSGNLKTAIIHGLEPSATGTQDYTLSGFGTPVAAIIVGTFCTAFDTVTNTNVIVQGFTDGTTSRCCGASEISGQGNAHSWCHSTDKFYARQYEYGTISHFEADFSSWITNGIRINWTKVNSSYRKKFFIVLIGGTDVSAKVGDFTPSSSLNGTVNVSSLGLDPEVVFFMGTMSNFNASFTQVQDGNISLGYAISKDGTEKNSCAYKSGDHYASTMKHHNGIFTDRCARIYDEGSSHVDYAIEMTGVGTGQFTVTTRDANNDIYEVGYLALELGGDDYDIVNQVLPNSSGTQDFPSSGSLSFSPEHLYSIATWNTAQDTDADADYNLAIGVANEANSQDAAHILMGEDNVATSDEDGIVSDTYSMLISNDAASIYKRGSVDTWDSNKLTIDFTVSGSRSCYGSLLLIGEGRKTSDLMQFIKAMI